MKIVDVAEFYAESGGGVKTYIDHKLRVSKSLGHDLTVVAPAKEDRVEQRDNGQVIWVKSRPVPFDPRYFLLTSSKTVHAILDDQKPDIVEASSPFGGAWFTGTWNGNAKKVLVAHQEPVAALAHSLLDRFISRKMIDRLCWPVWRYLRNLSAKFDSTVVAGQWLQNRLNKFGITNVTKIPFGIDTTPFLSATPEPTRRKAWLEKAKMSNNAQLLVAVSRHHPEKRLPTLIEAVSLANKSHPTALVIFGDGPSRKNIEKLTKSRPEIILAGYTRDRQTLGLEMASADAFIHGSIAETFGLVVAEAITAGLPLILPDEGGASDFAKPEYSETYIAGNVQDCAEAILRIRHRNTTKLKQSARNQIPSLKGLDDHFRSLFNHYGTL